MIKSLLIDDEINSRKALKQLIHLYCPQIEIIGEALDIEDAYNQILTLKPELLFLDIEMPHGTGFDLLLKFPHPQFDVIFVTGFDHYAINAFKFSAIDYLLKPIQTDELVAAVQKIKPKSATSENTATTNGGNYDVLIHNLSNQDRKHRRICIQTQSEMEIIRVGDIMYCEAAQNYTIFHLLDGKQFAATERIGEFENRFIDYDFFYRSHDSYLLNIEHVHKFNKLTQMAIMINGVSVPIARRRKAEFIEMLQEQFKG